MNDKKKLEIKSLNQNIMTEFSISELEERLETDPIALGTAADSAMQLSTECFTCTLCSTWGEFLEAILASVINNHSHSVLLSPKQSEWLCDF